MNRPAAWTQSPFASEFLPEEIDRLQAGTMILCERCQWPHPTNLHCDKCSDGDARAATPLDLL